MPRPFVSAADIRRAAGRWTSAAVVIVVVCLALASETFACPNCKDAVSTADPEGLNLARGYFYSILIMLAMPCMLVSSFGLYVWREMRRQKRSFGGASSAEAADADLDAFRPPAVSPRP